MTWYFSKVTQKKKATGARRIGLKYRPLPLAAYRTWMLLLATLLPLDPSNLSARASLTHGVCQI
jgi:hypothetical protein